MRGISGDSSCPRSLRHSPRSHPYSSHTVDSNTESAIAWYRCPPRPTRVVPFRHSSARLVHSTSLAVFRAPSRSLVIRPSFSTVGFQSDADTVSVSAPFRRSLHPCSIRVLRATATAGFDPSLTMERDARCARTMDKDGEQTNGSGSRRGCRSFVHGRGKTIVRIPSRSGLRGPVRSRGRGNERTRPSSQI